MKLTYSSPYGCCQVPTGREFTVIMSTMSFVLRLAGAQVPEFDEPLPVQRCQRNDAGVNVVVQVLDSDGNPVNLRLATSVRLRFLSPGGDVYATSAAFVTNGVDGRMTFSSTSTKPPLNQAGVWRVQAHVGQSAGVGLSTDLGRFLVQSNIQEAVPWT